MRTYDCRAIKITQKGDDTALLVEGLLQLFCVWLSASRLHRDDWDWMSH